MALNHNPPLYTLIRHHIKTTVTITPGKCRKSSGMVYKAFKMFTNFIDHTKHKGDLHDMCAYVLFFLCYGWPVWITIAFLDPVKKEERNRKLKTCHIIMHPVEHDLRCTVPSRGHIARHLIIRMSRQAKVQNLGIKCKASELTEKISCSYQYI